MKKWKTQYKKIDNASKFHEELREIFTSHSFFKLLHCYQEVNVKDLIPEYEYTNHHYDWFIQELNLIIELHGKQHYSMANFGNSSYDTAVKNFQDIQKRDSTKKRAAKENNFLFLEISYKSYNKLNAEEIIKNIKDLLNENSSR